MPFRVLSGDDMDSIGDLGINLLASVVAGLAVWAFQRFRLRLRAERRRTFFGMSPDIACVISVPRHVGSNLTHGVHRMDAAAMIEISAIARDCGSTVQSLVFDDSTSFADPLGERTEFCLGGPDANARTAVHLERLLPGVTFEPFDEAGPAVPLHVGGQTFVRVEDVEEYVVLARIPTSHRPVFLICGQSAQTNLVAARRLKSDYEFLLRKYGQNGRLCLVIRVDQPRVYAGGLTRIALDATCTAFGSGVSTVAPGKDVEDERSAP
ncbi:hypothetical protein ACR9E3_09230 [Actinomycetospora sp. C-140]